MHDLVEALNETYEFFTIAEQLENVESRQEIMKDLASQTTECAYFICDYCSDKGFGMSASYTKNRCLTFLLLSC